MIATMQIFGQIYVLTRGGPGYATTTLVYFIVNSAFREYQMGYSAVLSFVLLLLLLVVTIIQWKNQKRWVFYAAVYSDLNPLIPDHTFSGSYR